MVFGIMASPGWLGIAAAARSKNAVAAVQAALPGWRGSCKPAIPIRISAKERAHLMTIEHPTGIPALRTIAMPRDANANGDIFGGWLLAQMDLAGAVVAHERSSGRTATVAIEALSFLAPVRMGVFTYVAIDTEGKPRQLPDVEPPAQG
jgi:hypothetical protein